MFSKFLHHSFALTQPQLEIRKMVTQIQKPTTQPVETSPELTTATSVTAPQQYSPEDYLQMEVASEIRHEFRNGEIIPMTGGLPNHNKIAGNIYAVLNFAFRGQPYQVFFTDQRLWIPDPKIYTYPDIMVIQGELALQEGRRDTVTNPVLIVEVLSQSTQNYDRADKFAAYRTIESFQEYVLVDQQTQAIEHYVKIGTKKWNFQEYDATDLQIRLETVQVELAIADIYDKVEFEPAPAPSAPST